MGATQAAWSSASTTSPADATELDRLVQELRAARSSGDAASVGEQLKGKTAALAPHVRFRGVV
ncbi:MAG: hypothetical protein AAF721_35920 [Myxococcota bacterium]